MQEWAECTALDAGQMYAVCSARNTRHAQRTSIMQHVLTAMLQHVLSAIMQTQQTQGNEGNLFYDDRSASWSLAII